MALHRFKEDDLPDAGISCLNLVSANPGKKA